MNILLTGGTGFIGRRLAVELLSRGDTLILLLRRPSKFACSLQAKYGISKVRFVFVIDSGIGCDCQEISDIPSDIDIVINLAGESISRRWTSIYKQTIERSRINLTKRVVELMRAKRITPKLLISTSAIGLYPVNLDFPLDESVQASTSWLSQLCRRWEDEAIKLQPNRFVIFRLSVVLGPDDHFLKKIARIAKWMRPQILGSGKQHMPWVHVDDVVAAYLKAIDDQTMRGVYNLAAPEEVTHQKFIEVVASYYGKKPLGHIPSFFVQLIFGGMSTVILDGQKISVEKILESGFKFKHSKIEETVVNCLNKNQEL